MGPPDLFHLHLARELPFEVIVHVTYDGALVAARAHVRGFETDELLTVTHASDAASAILGATTALGHVLVREEMAARFLAEELPPEGEE